MIRKISTGAALLSLALAGTAAAQPAPDPIPLGPAFIRGTRACVAILEGKLSINPVAPASAFVGMVLADPVGAPDLAPFNDLSRTLRQFAGVVATDGAVAVAYDPSQKLCRVVALGSKDIAPVTAAVGPLGGDWKVVSDDPVQDLAVYTGTVFGSPKMTIRVRKPPKGNKTYGSASYMFSLKLAGS